jgi:hypothetical protein
MQTCRIFKTANIDSCKRIEAGTTTNIEDCDSLIDGESEEIGCLVGGQNTSIANEH